jgi:hypothetical protein
MAVFFQSVSNSTHWTPAFGSTRWWKESVRDVPTTIVVSSREESQMLSLANEIEKGCDATNEMFVRCGLSFLLVTTTYLPLDFFCRTGMLETPTQDCLVFRL